MNGGALGNTVAPLPGIARRYGLVMRVWIDLTNSPHVLVMRPVIEALERDGHEVRVTARDFAQTLGLLRRFEIPHTAIGHHRGERLAAEPPASRCARGRCFAGPSRRGEDRGASTPPPPFPPAASTSRSAMAPTI